jgi:hypothetical protein
MYFFIKLLSIFINEYIDLCLCYVLQYVYKMLYVAKLLMHGGSLLIHCSLMNEYIIVTMLFLFYKHKMQFLIDFFDFSNTSLYSFF